MVAPVELKCPECGSPLAVEDINMAADMALCRVCSRVSKFSELVQGKKDDEILNSIPRRMNVAKTVRGLEVTYRKPKGAGFSLLFFSIFWNAVTSFCLFGLVRGMTYESLPMLLFLIPFVLIGVGTFAGAFYMLFGHMTLTLNPGRGELFRGVGNLGRRQHFLLAEDSRISIEASNMERNHKTLDKIVVKQPDGKTFEFGTGIAEAEAREYVVALLRQMRR